MRIAVVGGGLSGTIATLHLLRSGPPGVQVTLVERQLDRLNRGVAYSARISQQLLNVPAARMGLFPDAMGDFHRWAAEGPHPHADGNAFLPRHRYGDFVAEQFRQAVENNPGRIRVQADEVVGLGRAPSGAWHLRLGNGGSVEADLVILALGHAPSGNVPHMEEAALRHKGYIPSPWKPGALDTVGRQGHVLFVGSGLTMVDLLLSLMDQGHEGPVTVVSRRGLLPGCHVQGRPWQWACPPPDPRTGGLGELLRWLRNEVRQALGQGAAWQDVMDAVRPCVQSWWPALAAEERRRFLRHLRPFWEVHRHRMPQEVHARVTALCRSGRVRLVAGRIRGVQAASGHLHIELDRRGGGTAQLAVDHLVNCTGPEADARRTDQPLLAGLLAQGVLCHDELGLGLQCTTEGAAVDRDGKVSDTLFLLGPMCKATLWECTAVPEIREQVARLVPRWSTCD